jgi:hypothetical protein
MANTMHYRVDYKRILLLLRIAHARVCYRDDISTTEAYLESARIQAMLLVAWGKINDAVVPI